MNKKPDFDKVKKIILLMDNKEENLEAWGQYLEDAGYTVLKALSIEQAELLMRSTQIHLAVMDVRMIDDSNKEDFSGVLLAERPEFSFLPKIILTSYEQVKPVIRALSERPDGSRVARTLVTRDPDDFLLGVKAAFDSFTVNWDLILHWPVSQPLDALTFTRFLLPHENEKAQEDAVVEFSGLFRQLFRDCFVIHFERLLWSTNGQVCLLLVGESDDKSQSYITKVTVCAELPLGARSLETFQMGSTTWARTLHFEGQAWVAHQTGAAHYEPFLCFYTTNSPSAINQVVERMLRPHLFAFEGSPNVSAQQAGAYLDHRHWNIPARVQQFVSLASQSGLTGLSLANGSLRLQLPGLDRLAWTSDPESWLELLPSSIESARWHRANAALLAERVLVNPELQPTLTDRSKGILVPIWHNFISFELSLRLGILHPDKLSHFIEAEELLAQVNTLGEMQLFNALEPEAKKFASVIQVIRKAAADTCPGSLSAYLSLLIFHILQVFSQDELTATQPRHWMHTRQYLLALLCLLSDRVRELQDLEHAVPDPNSKPHPLEFKLDADNGRARVGKEWIKLTDREVELIQYLMEHPGEVCSRQEIACHGFHLADPGYHDLNNLINTNLDRLRKKIEPDPAHPVFLITVPRRGIKLVIKPGE